MKNNCVAIIQARMGSSRLPQKIMKPLLKKPVIWHVINRVSQAEYIDKVIIATTTRNEDDVIESFCKKTNLDFFRGSESDVLDRYYKCAKHYHLKNIVRITADCPLHDPNVIDSVLAEYLNNDYEYVSNTIEYSFPDGLDVEVFTFGVLEKAWKNAESTTDREHVTPYIRRKSFNKKNIFSKTRYPQYRFTLDTPEDYQFIKSIYAHFGKDLFHLEDIIDYIKNSKPELMSLNNHLKLNEDYKRSIINETKKSIIIGDRVYLRALKLEDVSKEYCDWFNDPTVNMYLETKKTNMNELKRYVNEKIVSDDCLFYGIYFKDNGKHIGNLKIEPIDIITGKATLGIVIGDKNYIGQGICYETVKLITEYLFEHLPMNEINLGVIKKNLAAIKCYLKVGFIITDEFTENSVKKVKMVKKNEVGCQ